MVLEKSVPSIKLLNPLGHIYPQGEEGVINKTNSYIISVRSHSIPVKQHPYSSDDNPVLYPLKAGNNKHINVWLCMIFGWINLYFYLLILFIYWFIYYNPWC